MEKLLPQNVEAEQAFLGSVLIDPDQLAACASLLTPDDFARDAHRVIWEHMLDLAAGGMPVDVITLPDALARGGKLEEVGGTSYVTALANEVPHSHNAPHYAEIVTRKAALRRTIHASGQIAALAYHEQDPDAVYTEAMRLLAVALARPGQMTHSRSLSEVLDELLDDTLRRVEAAGTPGGYGLKTHFTLLDRHITMLEPGDLTYVAGRPGSGKSAFGLSLALNVALTLAAQAQGTVEYVTLEMPRVQQVRRLAVARSGVDSKLVRAGFRASDGGGRDPLDAAAYARFKVAIEGLREQAGQHLHFHDGAVSLSTLRAQVLRAIGERGARLVVIDQLDLFADEPQERRGSGGGWSGGGGGSGGGGSSVEFERITRFSRALKQLAVSCGVAIVCLAQLNRQSEYRANKRPMLADLRASGHLEQDSDHVWGLYRPAYYQATLEGASAQAQDRYRQFAELHVLKGRDVGAGELVPLRFEAASARFADWPGEWPMPADPSRETATAGVASNGANGHRRPGGGGNGRAGAADSHPYWNTDESDRHGGED